jgi:hypothetical protein
MLPAWCRQTGILQEKPAEIPMKMLPEVVQQEFDQHATGEAIA